jgi:tellurite resistance protein
MHIFKKEEVMEIEKLNSEKFDDRIRAQIEIVEEIKKWNLKASTEEAEQFLNSVKEALSL